MLKEFESWLLEQNYKPTTAVDYHGRIERLCRKEEFTLAHLVENISSILPRYETTGEKSSYGKRSHTGFKKISDVYPDVKLSRKYITSFVDKV